MIFRIRSTLLPLVIVTIIGLLILYASLPKKTNIMRADFNLEGASQNDHDAVAYIRQKYIIQPSVSSIYNLAEPNIKDTSQHHQATIIAKLFKNKHFGTFLEAGAYDGETFSNTLLLERDLKWTGLLVEPDPLNFSALKKRNRKAHLLHGCISPTIFIKEMTFSQNDTLGRIARPLEKTKDGKILTKVKCFPLFSLLLAQNLIKLDFLSLDIEGDEFKVLETVPWDSIDITVLMIEIDHIPEGKEVLKKFIEDKNYKFHSKVGVDFLFVNKNKLLELSL